MTTAIAPFIAPAAPRDVTPEERERSETNLADMASEVDALRRAAVDAVTDTRRLTVEVSTIENPTTPYDRVRLLADTPSGKMPIRILEGAHEQLAESVGVPWKYYERMLTAAPDLLATNVNRWHNQEPKKRLVRMLRNPIGGPHPDGSTVAARAILSDRYRALDHGSLLNSILPVARERGLIVQEWTLTEKQFYVRFKGDDARMAEMVPGAMNALDWQVDAKTAEAIMGEILGFGAALRNSETGHGALQLEPLFIMRRCLNAYVIGYYNKQRVVHVGGKLDESDIYQADTRTLDNAAVFLKVRDNLNAIFSGDARQKAAQTLLAGMTTRIAVPEAVGQFEFIDNVAQSFDLTDDEQRVLKEEVLAELQFTGRPLTPFAIGQGLTATARRLGTGNIGRKDELEHLGWRILEDPVAKLVKAASKN